MARILVADSTHIDTLALLRFIREAKLKAYASDGDDPQVVRKETGFDVLIEYNPAGSPWFYSDHYTGHFAAPGQEIVEWRVIPVWAMSYDGGMILKHWGNRDLADSTFQFLKEALRHSPAEHPYRGPLSYQSKDFSWVYENSWTGDVVRFKGEERIIHNGLVVFHQNYMGGMIIQKY